MPIYPTYAPNPILNPGQSGVRITTGRTIPPEIPHRNYTSPVNRGPGTPPYSNYTDPYASRRNLPHYIGFASKYPHVLPVDTNDPMALANAMLQPWLMAPPAPVQPPARRRPAGSGGKKQPGDSPPADDTKKQQTQATTTPAANPYIPPRDYVGTTQIDQGATLPASVVGENAGSGRFIDLQRVADVFGPNVARDIKPYADRVTNFFDSIGIRGSEQPDATVLGMRTDPNLTQQNPGGRTDFSLEGIGNRAASNIDAMEDLFAYNYRRGNLNPFAGQANAGMSEAATDWARNQGLNRDVYVQDLLSRKRGIDPYSAAVRQQRGY